MFKVLVTDHAKKNLLDLKKYGKKTLLQIKRVLGDLESDPYGMTKELHAPLQAYRSLHVGRFRAIIKIVKKEVEIVYIMGVGWHESGSRDDIYQRIEHAIATGQIKLNISN